MAHSLGYPHPDLMLSQLTAMQYQELLIFFSTKNKRQEEAKAAAEDSDIKTFMSRAIARQNKNGCR